MLVSDDEKAVKYLSTSLEGLNPCFSGCWSRTRVCYYSSDNHRSVLILVLVDVGLGRDGTNTARAPA